MLNVVICGTPGTGKSSLIERLKQILPDDFHYHNISKFAIENNCIASYDATLETHVIDEDKLTEKLEPLLIEKKLNIIECIHADLLPYDIVNWVFVCRTDNTKLYDRLKARNYSESKISNNVQAEIFQLVYDEALDCFGHSILTELESEEPEDLERNCKIVVERVNELRASLEE